MNSRVVKIILAAVFLIAAIALLAWYTGIGGGKTAPVETEEGAVQMPTQIR